MMKPFSTVLVAALLTACGGGGGGASSSPAPAASAAPAPAPASATPAPAATTPAVVLETPPTATGFTINAGRMNIATSGGDYSVAFNAKTTLEVLGNLNRFWITAAQPGGDVGVSGDSNTLVFRPSATPGIVMITGSANTIYLPEGSAITLAGAGVAMSTIKYYKP